MAGHKHEWERTARSREIRHDHIITEYRYRCKRCNERKTITTSKKR